MLKFPPSSNTLTLKLALSAPGAAALTSILGMKDVVPFSFNSPSKMFCSSAENERAPSSKE